MRFSTTHRIVRLYYLPRVIAYALGFGSSLILFIQGVVSWAMLPYVAIVTLVYPHIACLRAAYSKDGKQAELQNLLLDAFVVGTWMAVIDYNLGLSFAVLCAVCLNNTLNGGVRRGARAVLYFVLGCTVASMVTGFNFNPLNSGVVTFLGLFSIFIYALLVSLVFHGQNRRLLRAKNEVDHKRRVFKGLVSAGLEAGASGNLEDVLTAMLSHLGVMLGPDSHYAFVLRDTRRTPGFHFALVFPEGDSELQEVIDQASSLAAGRCSDAMRELNVREHMECFSMEFEDSFMEGLLLIRGAEGGADSEEAVTLFMQKFQATIENRFLIRKLRQLATTDALTGLANRARFDNELEKLTEQTTSDGIPGFSLLAIDINGLKPINDEYGHEAGDALLQAAAGLLRGACRESDLVARMGGDEFLVLCPAVTVSQTQALVARIRKAIEEIEIPVTAQGNLAVRLRLSMSIGTSSTHECDPSELMHLADSRMYAEKAAHYKTLSH